MNFLHEFSPTHEQTDAETDIQIYVSTINVFRNLISKNCAIVQLKKQKKTITITSSSHQSFSEFSCINVWVNFLILYFYAFHHIMSCKDLNFIHK